MVAPNHLVFSNPLACPQQHQNIALQVQLQMNDWGHETKVAQGVFRPVRDSDTATYFVVISFQLFHTPPRVIVGLWFCYHSYTFIALR